MLRLFLIACLIAAASAGYNYQSTEPKVVQSSHTVHESAPISQTHDDGYEKHYYTFNAPEEHVDHHKVVQNVPIQQNTKKTLQVIFIKPPEQKHSPKKVIQHLTQNVVEEKTHIYVLSKEPNHAIKPKHAQVIQQATVHHHKPDIHFLKYKTPADAHHIQQSIIQQYGGKPSEIIHGGNNVFVNFASTGSNDHLHSKPSVSREYLAPLAP